MVQIDDDCAKPVPVQQVDAGFIWIYPGRPWLETSLGLLAGSAKGRLGIEGPWECRMSSHASIGRQEKLLKGP
jgi:hypothetical protein